MLNPWGDLIAMARAWCLVKPGGYGLVGVPAGPDVIAFNSHKMYGRHGLAQIFANWEQVTDWSHSFCTTALARTEWVRMTIKSQSLLYFNHGNIKLELKFGNSVNQTRG